MIGMERGVGALPKREKREFGIRALQIHPTDRVVCWVGSGFVVLLVLSKHPQTYFSCLPTPVSIQLKDIYVL